MKRDDNRDMSVTGPNFDCLCDHANPHRPNKMCGYCGGVIDTDVMSKAYPIHTIDNKGRPMLSERCAEHVRALLRDARATR